MTGTFSYVFISLPARFSAGASAGLFVGLAASAMAQQFPLGAATELTSELSQTRRPTPGDFNGDGQEDVVVSSATTTGLWMFAGAGQTGFGSAARIADSGRIVLEFAATDLDGDGDLDIAALLAAGTSSPKRLVRLLNDGAAGFSESTILDGAGTYQSIKVADLTGDGAPDLVLSRGNGSLYEVVYLPAQGAGYGSPTGSIVSSYSGDFLVADIDADGVLDIATDKIPQGELAFARGLGSGTFAPGVSIQPAGGAAITFPARFDDIDGDGDLDCLSDVTVFDARLRYYSGLGAGTFGPPTFVGGITQANTLKLFDADGDGDLDIGSIQRSSSSPFADRDPTIILQSAPGSFGPRVITFADFAADSALSDIDGNGRQDFIAVGTFFTSPLTWRLNNVLVGHGFFGPSVSAPSPPFSNVWRRAVGDLDGDGDDDVIVTEATSDTPGVVGWIENVAPGVTAPPVGLFTTSIIRATPYLLDVDGDSDLDLVVEASDASGGASEFWLNDGGMSFSLASKLIAVGTQIQRTFHVEDMDGDGDADVVIGKATSQLSNLEVRLYRNTGTGAAFQQYAFIYGPAGVHDLEIGEFNGDNLRDIVTINATAVPGESQLQVYFGLPAGQFSDPIALSGTVETVNISTGDFDSDGLTDLFVWDMTDGIVMRRAAGGGMFDGPVQLVDSPTTSRALPVYPIDFDADGDTDILYPLVTSNASALSIAEQLPGGVMRDGFPAGANGPLGFGLQAPALADLDGDGDGELIVVELGKAIAYENHGIVNVGSAFCTGPGILGATLSAVGSEALSDNRVTLVAAGIQSEAFGIAVGSRTFGAPVPVMGTQGTICLTGAIGRYDGPGQVLNSGPVGIMSLDLDLSALETPGGSVTGQVGESWSFQFWHRVTVAAGQSSRFTTGVTVQLR